MQLVYNWTNIYRRLWPTQCMLCLAEGSYPLDICTACHERLPRNRHACRICALPLPQTAPALSVCGGCASKAPIFRQLMAPFRFEPPIDDLVVGLKFAHRLQAGRLLGELLAAEMLDAPRPQALVPIPLHATRLRSRGFNQAQEIALRVGRTIAVPVLSQLMVRMRATPAQSQLGRRQRLANLRAAFRCRKSLKLDHVVLVDDVATTGATAQAAAQALRQAGVKTVDVWAVARTPNRN